MSTSRTDSFNQVEEQWFYADSSRAPQGPFSFSDLQRLKAEGTICAAKYRRVVMSEKVNEVLRDVCLEVSKRWEIFFLEIGVDGDHAHFLIQSVPTYSPTKIVQTVKSLTARQVFARALEVKKQLWGGEFWGKGYFVNTVGQHGSEKVIAAYVQNQGHKADYRQLHKGQMDLGLS